MHDNFESFHPDIPGSHVIESRITVGICIVSPESPSCSQHLIVDHKPYRKKCSQHGMTLVTQDPRTIMNEFDVHHSGYLYGVPLQDALIDG